MDILARTGNLFHIGEAKWLDTHDVLIWCNAFYSELITKLGTELERLQYPEEHINEILGYIIRSKLNVERGVVGPDDKGSYERTLNEICNLNIREAEWKESKELLALDELFLHLEWIYQRIRNRLQEGRMEYYNDYISSAILFNTVTRNAVHKYMPSYAKFPTEIMSRDSSTIKRRVEAWAL